MNSTYSKHAEVCARFYDLAVDMEAAAAFVWREAGLKAGDRALFVGSMFGIAAGLLQRGARLTVVDYADEMVELGRRRLPHASVEKADLRALPYRNEFDAVVVVGRVFTHMISDRDLRAALASCRYALKDSGTLFLDNYEDTRIEATGYFNGALRLQEGATQISRDSSTTRLSASPLVVQWNASYSGFLDGAPFAFRDSMPHRAWSRSEIRSFLSQAGFEPLAQGDNFDETSFFTLARAAPTMQGEPYVRVE